MESGREEGILLDDHEKKEDDEAEEERREGEEISCEGTGMGDGEGMGSYVE